MFVICISVSGMFVFGNVFIGTRERRIKDGGPLEVDGFQNEGALSHTEMSG